MEVKLSCPFPLNSFPHKMFYFILYSEKKFVTRKFCILAFARFIDTAVESVVYAKRVLGKIVDDSLRNIRYNGIDSIEIEGGSDYGYY